jgi:hypothetical protein
LSNKLLLCLAFAVPFALSFNAAAAAPAPADNGPAPVAVVDAFHAALKANDPVSALHLLSVDASIYEQGFVDQTRSDYAGAHIAADSAFASTTDFQVLERRIIWLGDNAACVISRSHTQGNFQGHPINLVGTETMVLQRSGSSWSIEHIHWSAHPAEGELKPADEKH